MCILLFFSVQFKTNVKILSRFVLKRKTCSVEIKLNQNETGNAIHFNNRGCKHYTCLHLQFKMVVKY